MASKSRWIWISLLMDLPKLFAVNTDALDGLSGVWNSVDRPIEV